METNDEGNTDMDMYSVSQQINHHAVCFSHRGKSAVLE